MTILSHHKHNFYLYLSKSQTRVEITIKILATISTRLHYLKVEQLFSNETRCHAATFIGYVDLTKIYELRNEAVFKICFAAFFKNRL